MLAGIAAWTCHQPSSVFDVVPGDLVSSTILAAAAATTQASRVRYLSCYGIALSASEHRNHLWLFTCLALAYISRIVSASGWSNTSSQSHSICDLTKYLSLWDIIILCTVQFWSKSSLNPGMSMVCGLT